MPFVKLAPFVNTARQDPCGGRAGDCPPYRDGCFSGDCQEQFAITGLLLVNNMTAYANFIQDFPARCIEILDKSYKQAEDAGREVTLMLAVATAAFIIPFERLRPLPAEHPADDVEIYREAKRKFDKAINGRFRLSHRWGQGRTWEFIEAINGEDIRTVQVDHWARPEARLPLSNDKLANPVFSHLRNALAHGSIFTYPNSSGTAEPPLIETILFVSRCYQEQEIEKCGSTVKEKVALDKYDVLLVSPQDFLVFLKKWVEFLASLDLVSTVTQSSILDMPEADNENTTAA